MTVVAAFSLLGVVLYQGDLARADSVFWLKYFLSSQSAILWMSVLFFMSTAFYWLGFFGDTSVNSFGFDIHTYVDGEKKIRFMLIGEISESGAAFADIRSADGGIDDRDAFPGPRDYEVVQHVIGVREDEQDRFAGRVLPPELMRLSSREILPIQEPVTARRAVGRCDRDAAGIKTVRRVR